MALRFCRPPGEQTDGAATRAIALDKIWSGRQQEGAPFFMQLSVATGTSRSGRSQECWSAASPSRATLFCVRSDAICCSA